MRILGEWRVIFRENETLTRKQTRKVLIRWYRHDKLFNTLGPSFRSSFWKCQSRSSPFYHDTLPTNVAMLERLQVAEIAVENRSVNHNSQRFFTTLYFYPVSTNATIYRSERVLDTNTKNRPCNLSKRLRTRARRQDIETKTPMCTIIIHQGK